MDYQVTKEWSGHEVGEILKDVPKQTGMVYERHGMAKPIAGSEPAKTVQGPKDLRGRQVPDPVRSRMQTAPAADKAQEAPKRDAPMAPLS